MELLTGWIVGWIVGWMVGFERFVELFDLFLGWMFGTVGQLNIRRIYLLIGCIWENGWIVGHLSCTVECKSGWIVGFDRLDI